MSRIFNFKYIFLNFILSFGLVSRYQTLGNQTLGHYCGVPVTLSCKAFNIASFKSKKLDAAITFQTMVDIVTECQICFDSWLVVFCILSSPLQEYETTHLIIMSSYLPYYFSGRNISYKYFAVHSSRGNPTVIM